MTESNGSAPNVEADDPFNLAALREPQSLVHVRQRRLSVPVRKRPNRLDFVRVHPDPSYRVNMALFSAPSDSGDEDVYFVRPEMLAEIAKECRHYTIFTAVNLQGGVFLWRVALPVDDGREPNTWLTTNREAAELAITKWVRVASDRNAGAYSVIEYEGPPIEPAWPKESFLDLLKLAFKNKIIDRPDHPMVLRLRGIV